MKKDELLPKGRGISIALWDKIWKIMRLTGLFLLISFVAISAETYSQNTRFSFKMENSTLNNLFLYLEQNSGYRFAYNKSDLDDAQKISCEFTNESIDQILKKILDTEKLSILIKNEYIIITGKNNTIENTILGSQSGKNISGKVTDSSGAPLPGVSVVIKGTTSGVITDAEGKFSLAKVFEDATLQFSFVGMKTQEVKVAGKTAINVTLTEETVGIDEVVAVGYGTQKKATLTGAVSSIKGDDLVKSPTANVSTLLAGRLPGVIVNSRSGEPGGDNANILIRGRGTTGDNSPLILIDGVERSGLGQLNPNDIQSVSVLKDAEAAIYGSRASNGVIVVTTKRGTEGKPIINFTYNQTFSQPTRNPKMVDSYTFASVANEIRIRENGNPNTQPTLAYSTEQMEKFRIGTEPGYLTTNYFDLMTRNWTPEHRSNLSVSGGNERVKYFFSFGELRENGQYTGSSIKYNQYNVRSNLDVKVTNSLTACLDIAGQSDFRHCPYYSSYDLVSHIFLYAPNWQLYWPGTNYLKPLRGNQSIINMIGDGAGWNEITNKKFQSSLTLKWEVPWVEGLNLSVSGSHDASYQYWKTFQTPSYVYTENATTNTYIKVLDGMGPSKAVLTDRSTIPSSTYFLAKIDYSRSFDNHNINAMVGYEQTQQNLYYMAASKQDYESTALPILNVGGTDKLKWGIEGYSSEFARQNFFGKVNYDYKGKYLIQGTLRADGSSNFPKDDRYGYFPSVSAGWRMSEELFMKNIDWLNNLKLKASWGMMGNDRIANFQYLMTYSYGNNFVFNNQDVLGLYETRVPNPNITWETSKTWDLGLESKMWGGKFGIEFDWFRSFRDDILGKRNATVPNYTGLSLPDENIASVLNKGFELVLTHQNMINKFSYTLSGNIAFARNKIKFIDEAPAAEPYQTKTGKPYGSELFYDAIGIFKDQEQVNSYPHLPNAGPGDLIFRDTNNDGVINEKDQILVTQNEIPEITFGLNSSFKYKGFDLSILLQGQENAKIWMVKGKGNIYSNFFSTMSDSWGGFLQWRANGRWIPGADNTDAIQPRANSAFSNVNSSYNTHWIRNGGFLRVKNVEIGYNMPKKLVGQLGLSNVRISASANNLFLIYDGMKNLGFDPETSDFWFYSVQRTINFGINLTF